jgi:hypothetical protein
MDHHMSRIPFSESPELGIRRFFHYDDSDNCFYIETEQDMSPIIEANREAYNNAPDRWGEWTRVASIPLSIYYDLKKKGIADDDEAMKRWLNDYDNRFFRTKSGVI